MKCPKCQGDKFRTIDSRKDVLIDLDGGENIHTVRRKKICKYCEKAIVTVEVVESVFDHTQFRRDTGEVGAPSQAPPGRSFDVTYALIDGVTLEAVAQTIGYTRQRASQIYKRVLTYISGRVDVSEAPCEINADLSIIRKHSEYWTDVIKVFCEDNDILLDFDFIYDVL